MSTSVQFAVDDLLFEWDQAKATANRRKHGVTFEEAATVFLDPLQRILDDPDSSRDEDRVLLFGVSFALRALLVVHVERGERIRIISARLATRKERIMMETR